tara:strand:- start:7351 stop:8391 length:1041 start_codon:yes stop_codon:yes gene_type:complete
MLKIGFIVGKNDEIYKDKSLRQKTPKKFFVDNHLHSDVAIAMIIKIKYPDIMVDIILPNEISKKRLKKNQVNFAIGYDCINAINEDPYVKKFSTDEGLDEIYSIFKDKSCKIFPTFEHNNFTWDKKKYMIKYSKNKLPIPDSIFFKPNHSIQKLINQIKSYRWNDFIIKPIGGTTGLGFEQFSLNKCISDLSILEDYFKEYNYYKEFIVQQTITGFKTYGEIKMFWINNQFSYAVNIKRDNVFSKETVKFVSDAKVLEECKKISKKAVHLFPPMKVNGKNVDPVVIRTDLTCCLNNDNKSKKYYLNEVENQIAHSYSDKPGITYPYIPIVADAYVKKAYELVELGF